MPASVSPVYTLELKRSKPVRTQAVHLTTLRHSRAPPICFHCRSAVELVGEKASMEARPGCVLAL